MIKTGFKGIISKKQITQIISVHMTVIFLAETLQVKRVGDDFNPL